jgi:uncharacterized protein YciI
MWYSIIGEDVENSLEKRTMSRPAHLKRLLDLKNQGRLLIAGPQPSIDNEDPGPAGFTGSIIIAEFENLLVAKAWAESDPYVKAGVYSAVKVKPFKKVLP